MKIKNLLFAMICGAFLFTACSDDDAPRGMNEDIPSNVLKAFQEAYPNVQDVNWDNVKGYHVARFNAPASRSVKVTYTHSVWFTAQGNICQAEEEMTFDQLPAMVQEGLMMYKAQNYPDAVIDECETLERADMGTVFVVELENGDEEREISLSPYGDILKDVLDDEDDDEDDILPLVIPEEIKEALQKLFPTEFEMVSIVEIEFDDDEIEVDVLYTVDGKTLHKEIKFSLDYQWIGTETEISLEDFLNQMEEDCEDLRQEIIKRAEDFKVNVLDPIVQNKIKVEKIEFEGTVSYKFELKSGKKEITFQINANGKLTVTVEKD